MLTHHRLKVYEKALALSAGQPRRGCLVFDVHTQGSSFLATPGFAAESLWDSKCPNCMPWDSSDGYHHVIATRWEESARLSGAVKNVSMTAFQLELGLSWVEENEKLVALG
jgi:hypothetical protein